eukprot:GHUV01026306.1.p1 GENE.GHUV01026306.1~~GHUV01026306.1.p1  ORF type:complete len:114 (-),score=5.77 GHUV01026306.1:729-1070(-)
MECTPTSAACCRPTSTSRYTDKPRVLCLGMPDHECDSLLLTAVPLHIRAMTCPPRMRHATVLKSHLGAEKRFSSCKAGAALLAASIISTVAATHSHSFHAMLKIGVVEGRYLH